MHTALQAIEFLSLQETLYLLENDKLSNRRDVAEDAAKQAISNDAFHLFITVARYL